jgi:ParB-like chromosome segregation protein Spo0J
LSDLTGYSEQTVSRYLQLLKLPEEVQTHVGKGKLGMTNAIIILKLADTPYENMILQLAQEAVTKGISRKELEKRVAMIKKKGVYHEEKKLCVGCSKVYSREQVSYPCLCPECVGKLRMGGFDISKSKRTIAMLQYINLRDWAEKKREKGIELPDWFFARLQELHYAWKGELNLGHDSAS